MLMSNEKLADRNYLLYNDIIGGDGILSLLDYHMKIPGQVSNGRRAVAFSNNLKRR